MTDCADRTPPCFVIRPHVHPDGEGVSPGVRVIAAPGDVISGVTYTRGDLPRWTDELAEGIPPDWTDESDPT